MKGTLTTSECDLTMNENRWAAKEIGAQKEAEDGTDEAIINGEETAEDTAPLVIQIEIMVGDKVAMAEACDRGHQVAKEVLEEGFHQYILAQYIMAHHMQVAEGIHKVEVPNIIRLLLSEIAVLPNLV